MSVISALFDSRIYNFEQAFGVKDLTSPDMREAIRDWYDLYFSSRPTEWEDPCQRLPVAVVSKLTKTAFSEYSAQVNGEGKKAPQVGQVLEALERCREKAAQQALIGGACFMKPIFTRWGIDFGVVSRVNYLVLARNGRDEITDLGTAERAQAGGTHYTLLERRTVDQGGYLTIQSRLYQSRDKSVLGNQVPLDTLPQYAALQPVFTLPQPVGSLGLIPVRTPLENCVDGSPDSVSVYAPAAGLIHNINANEAQINGEFQRGESRIIVSGDMMTVDEDGKRRRLKDHVFTAVDEDPGDMGVTIFSPAFREQSFLNRKREYLRNVETVIGLKRGILSEVEAVERTAKEVTSSEGDYNLTIIDFQRMWEKAVREAVRVCDILGRMYAQWPSGAVDPEKDVIIDFGDGVLFDRDKVNQEMLSQVQAGLLSPERYLGWYYELPCDTLEERRKIRESYMPELERLTAGEG